ncbi:MAG: TolC family protein [Planctomycetota bacterium]
MLQLYRFKLRLGLSVSDPIAIAPLEFAVPEPEITTEAAVAAALDFRLDLQNERDRLVDARRAINNARNALLPDLDIAGEVGVPTDDDDREGGVLFDFDDTTYRASVSLGLPLDREIERLQLRDRIIRFERARRDFEQFRDQVTLDSRAAVRSVDLARFSLNLAEQQVEINRRRLQEQQLKEDEVSQQEIVDSENALLDAQNSRDAALTGLRNAVLNYLETTGQLRVAPDGTFQPLPGMTDAAGQP